MAQSWRENLDDSAPSESSQIVLRPCLIRSWSGVPLEPTDSTAALTTCTSNLSTTVLSRLLPLCKELDLSVREFCDSAWALLLSRYTNSPDLCFGSLGAGSAKTCLSFTHVADEIVTLQLLAVFSRSQEGNPCSAQILAWPLEQARLFNTATCADDKAIQKKITGIDLILNVADAGNGGRLSLHWTPSSFSEVQARRILATYKQLIASMTCNPTRPLKDLRCVSSMDLDQLKQWNSHELPNAQECFHDYFRQQVAMRPDAQAICGAEMSMTYTQLDTFSDHFCHLLTNRGVNPGAMVPILLDRSSLVPVVILGIHKAGASFVPLHPELPDNRMRYLSNTINARVAVINAGNEYRLKDLGIDNIVSISLEILNSLSATMAALPTPSPNSKVSISDPAYVLLTSGSTGNPKGVVVSHHAVCSSSLGYGGYLGMGPHTRMFQFSAYTFDACIVEIITTLMFGGCVCIPTEEERMNDAAGAIRRLSANVAMLTPTTLSILDSDTLDVDQLVVGGEKLPKHIQIAYSRRASLHQGYGPTEAAVFATMKLNLKTKDEPQNIGKAVWTRIWLAHPDNPDQLVPIQTVGEILIEGPGLAQCYLGNPEATAQAFRQCNGWYEGHTGTYCYRTGDLARFNQDGSIHFIGRRDTQVKIRGQRMEISEVNEALFKYLPKGIRGTALTIPHRGSYRLIGCLESWNHHTKSLSAMVEDVKKGLASDLPSYMVPSEFFTFNRFPCQSSGKLDLKRLQMYCKEKTADAIQAVAVSSSANDCLSAKERGLRELWAVVLSQDSLAIGHTSHFIRLGGDSIRAMQLSSEARGAGMTLRVSDILANPVFSDMAARISIQKASASRPSRRQPFSLIPKDEVTRLLHEGSVACKVTIQQIEDLYPCSPLQEGFMAISLRQPGAYIDQYVFQIPSSISLGVFRRSWESVYNCTPILRTRIFLTETGQLLQLVVRERLRWQGASDLDKIVQDAMKIGLGGPLSHYTLVRDQDSGCIKMVLTLHHAINDGWTMHVIQDRLHKIYAGQALVPDDFGLFIGHLQSLERDKMAEFWRSYLEGAKRTPLPSSAGVKYRPQPCRSQRRSISLQQSTLIVATRSVLIYLAWAIVLSRWSGEEEIVLQTTVTGREEDLASIDSMAGPTITNIPVRVPLYTRNADGSRRGRQLRELVQEMQEFFTKSSEHQHFGMQNIQALNPETQQCCDFDSLIVIQPDLEAITKGNRIFVAREAKPDLEGKHHYGLLLNCELREASVNILASYDPKMLGDYEIEWMLRQLDLTLAEITRKAPQGGVDDLASVDQDDKKLLTVWNSGISPVVSDCIHNLIARQWGKSPDAPAVNAWDANFTYAELFDRADRLAGELIRRGVGPEQYVPLAFHKSAWVVVAILATFRAGAAFVLLDMEMPLERLRFIIEKVGARVVVYGGLALEGLPLMSNVALVLCDIQTVGAWSKSIDELPRVMAKPENAAYLIFTSGSTGEPKGCVIQHESFCTSAMGIGRALGVSVETRSLQFSSYSFAATFIEILIVLINGGCVCILSDEERINDLAGGMESRGVNWAFMTPSVLSVLNVDLVPTLKTLIVSGEAIRSAQIKEWAGVVDELHQGYGSAECCGAVCTNRLNSQSKPKDVGQPRVSRCWLVDPHDVSRLAPLGCVGEILIEGAVVGRGYLHEPEKTAAAFINSPAWRHQFDPSPANNARFYKTGDLARYGSPDGLLQLVGRKDTQVKFHGQRIELGEIEHNLKKSLDRSLDVVVELVVPFNGTRDDAMLIAFLVLDDEFVGPEHLKNLSEEVKTMTCTIATSVVQVMKSIVPEYMIPTAFIPLKSLPLTLSGKTYRKKLREMAGSLTVSELNGIVSRSQGIIGQKKHTVQQLFALPASTETEILSQLADIKGMADIEDIYPALPIQQELVMLSSITPGRFTAQLILRPTSCSFQDLGQAWEKTIEQVPILRTRIVLVQESKALQVVCRQSIIWDKAEDLQAYLDQSASRALSFGDPLLRTAVCKDASSGKQVLVLTLHHALYDGVSIGLIMGQINRNLSEENIKPLPGMGQIVKYIESNFNSGSVKGYWTSYLRGASPTRFPDPPNGYNANPTSLVVRELPSMRSAVRSVTTSTILRTAWALVHWQHTSNGDVVFGSVVNGRNTSVASAEVVGPMASVVPVRIQIKPHSTIRDFLSEVQSSTIDMFPFESTGHSQIRSFNEDTATACDFQTLFVVHVLGTGPRDDVAAFSHEETSFGKASNRFYLNPLVVECNITEAMVKVTVHFDKAIVSQRKVQTLVSRFYWIARQLLCLDERSLVRDISFATPEDVQHLLAVNQHYESLDQDLISHVKQFPQNLPSAIKGRVWVTSPWNSRLLLGPDAIGEVFVEEEVSEITPLCNLFWPVNSPINVGPVVSTGMLGQLALDGAVNILQPLEKNAVMEEMTEPKILCDSRIPSRLTSTETSSADSSQNTTTSGLTPGCGIEQALTTLWASILSLDVQNLAVDDDFFSCGGDSLKAMRLVAGARKMGYSLQIRDIYNNSKLRDMALICRVVTPSNTKPQEVSQEAQRLPEQTLTQDLLVSGPMLRQLGFEESDVEQILPCLPLQAAMLATSLAPDKGLLYYYRMSVPDGVDIGRLRDACSTLIRRHTILRTAFAKTEDGQTVQIVLKPSSAGIPLLAVERGIEDAEHYIRRDRQAFNVYGGPILQFALIQSGSGKRRELVFRLSHAQFDGNSFPIFLEDLQDGYNGKTLGPTATFSDFMRAVRMVPHRDCQEYWSSVLGAATESRLIIHQRPSTTHKYDTFIHRQLCDARLKQARFPISSILKAAWAMTVGVLLEKQDILFGELTRNRNLDMSHPESVLGPCINIVPVRVQLDRHQTCHELLAGLKRQSVDRVPFESVSPETTMKGRTPWPHMTRFSSVVAHQDIRMNEYLPDRKLEINLGGEVCGWSWTEMGWDMADVVVSARPLSGQYRVELAFCSKLLTPDIMEYIADILAGHIETICLAQETSRIVLGARPKLPYFPLSSSV